MRGGAFEVDEPCFEVERRESLRGADGVCVVVARATSRSVVRWRGGNGCIGDES